MQQPFLQVAHDVFDHYLATNIIQLAPGITEKSNAILTKLDLMTHNIYTNLITQNNTHLPPDTPSIQELINIKETNEPIEH